MQQQYNTSNADILVWVGDQLWPRGEAKVSVFDSSVQGGDAVWEGLRVYDGRIFSLHDHLDRLFASAKTMAFADVPSRDFIIEAIRKTLVANHMRDGAHIRLTLTRGEKYTSSMDPRVNTKGCTLIVLAEWKPPVFGDHSLRLITSSVRRNSPSCIDSKIHHNNLINNILAKIEANLAGVDEAIMLDLYGFVAETNACNLFMAKNGTLYTPHGDACLPGITRGKVIKMAATLGIPCVERNLSVGEFYNADEVFITGTMGELTNISEIDGRVIENLSNSDIRRRLHDAYRTRTQNEGVPIVP
jgi:branched-chain amino acid aminotransferase